MTVIDTTAKHSSRVHPSAQEPAGWKRYVTPDTFIQIGIAIFTLTLWEVTSRVFQTDFWTSRPSQLRLSFTAGVPRACLLPICGFR